MSADGDLHRLERIIDASCVSERIETLLPVGVRPRQLSVRTLLTGMLLALRDERPAHLVRVHQALRGLPEVEQRRLGVLVQWKNGPHLLTYRQTERTFKLVTRALATEHPDGKPSEILSETADRLLEASVKVLGVPESSSLAIDWTDYESFARPPRKRHAPEQHEQTQAPQNTTEENPAGDDERPEQPQQSCADHEAAWGHRNTNHPSRNETFYGYYLQTVTIVKQVGGLDVPELVRRIALSSARHDPPAQIVPVLQRMKSEGIEIDDLLADSGYAYREPQTFAIPVRATGANLVIDLHPNDRGMKGTHQGATIANGNLYCPATPKTLLQLGPPPPAATDQDLHAHDQKTQELSRYKLSPHGAPDHDGYRRVICPAQAGKLRCPHKPTSMSLSHEHPTILSPPEQPPLCCAQQTITVPPTVNSKTAQKHDYPSKAHRRSYARRTAAERSFSQLSDPASTDIKRGWCRLMGLTPNTLFLACALTTANIRVADAHTARQTEEQRRAAHGLPPRKRQRRRHTPRDPATQANAPPAIAA